MRYGLLAIQEQYRSVWQSSSSVIDLDDLTARKEEENTTASLLRGECEAFRQRGAKLSGLSFLSKSFPSK